MEPHELARRVQAEQLIDEGVVAVQRREPLVELAPDRAVGLGGGGSGQVVVVDRGVSLLTAADLGTESPPR
jgi:hypothetical protein